MPSNQHQFPATPRPPASPWGPVQTAQEVAPGIWRVSTASHGGYLLSDERVAAMPAVLNVSFAGSEGAFEEDCDWALVAVAFPAEFGRQTVYHAVKKIMGSDDYFTVQRDWLRGAAGQPARAIADAWAQEHAECWEAGWSASSGGKTTVDYRRVKDGAEIRLVGVRGDPKGLLTGPEMEALMAAAQAAQPPTPASEDPTPG